MVRIPSRSLSQGIAFFYIALMLLPLAALILKASERPLGELWGLVTAPAAVASYQLTFGAASVAAGINCVFGLILAWILVRYEFPGRRLADGLVDLPFAMPAVVAGIALMSLYSPSGTLGQLIQEGTPLGSLLLGLGIRNLNMTSSLFGVLLAKVFVTLPFVVRTVQPVLMEIEPEVEEAAQVLGANQIQTFRRVIFPQLLPALLTGFTLAFARAVGEYGVVTLISGNIPFRTMISSVYVYRRLEEFDLPGATAVAIVLLLCALVVMTATNGFQWWSRRYDR